MRTFEHFTQGHHSCPICGTDNDKETILIPIEGTQEGSNMEALQVHTECLQNGLVYYSEMGGMIIARADKPYKVP
jgi:hypothetical protein